MNLLQIEADSSPAPPGASTVRPLIERLAALAIEEAAGRLSEMLPLPMEISYFDSVLSDSVRKNNARNRGRNLVRSHTA